jgi:hypothetical protein
MQLSLFYDYQSMLDSSSFYRKYDAIFQAVELAISHSSSQEAALGRKGYGFTGFTKALVYKHQQSIKSVPELLRDLESRPIIAEMCGFLHGKLPDDSRFYEFLKKTNNSKFQEILHASGKILEANKAISLDVLIADSKPVKANTKHNNPKNPNRSLNKHKKIKRNPKATLSYYSYSKQPTEAGFSKKFTFFWGYRTHVLISAEGIPLVEITKPNNITDDKIAKKLLNKLVRVYGQKKGRTFIADSGYDSRELYDFIVKQIKAKPYIPINPRNKQPDKVLGKNGCPLCKAGLEMKSGGISPDGKRVRKKFRCPIKAATKKETLKLPKNCPVNNRKFIEGARYGCTAYIDVTNDARAQVPRESPEYKAIYNQRTEVERYFARLGDREAERTNHYEYRSIQNQMTIAHLSLSLTALAAVAILNNSKKLRATKTLAEAA